jgi:hypothetical protein
MSALDPVHQASTKQILGIALLIFLTALGVRLLTWHDTRLEAPKVQSGVVEGYRHMASLLRQDGIRSFFKPSARVANPNFLGHPPGYPILLALLFKLFGESDTVVQLFQIVADALAAVLVFLIVIELLPRASGVIAGLLVALSPQFAWNSVLLLPDTLAVLPILLAIYCLVRAYKRPRLGIALVGAAGILIGLSCWLRANALLMPAFLILLIPILFKPGRRLTYAAALLGGTLLILAPLMIRNWIVFNHFIPVSLGAGQTFLEGISDYDKEKRFGIPDTDLGIMRMEAEQYNRPDYYSTLFAPDGVKRERMRLTRGLAIAGKNPAWFLGVMTRRAASMLRLERARPISARPHVSHTLALNDQAKPIWESSPREMLEQGTVTSAQAHVTLTPDGQTLSIITGNTKYQDQLASAPVAVQPDTDYLFQVPLTVEQGRVIVSVKSVDSGESYVSTIAETLEGKTPAEQPVSKLELPFVSGSSERVRVVLSNGAPLSGHSIVRLGTIKLFELGHASSGWTRYPRLLIRGLQRLFITAVMLPLVFLGVFLMARARKKVALAVLLAVPAYYLCFQSALHTEYRYVLAVHYFLFAIAAVAIYWLSNILYRGVIYMIRPVGRASLHQK